MTSVSRVEVTNGTVKTKKTCCFFFFRVSLLRVDFVWFLSNRILITMSSLDNLRRYFQELGEYATGSTESSSTTSFGDTKALSQDIINLVSSDIQDKDLGKVPLIRLAASQIIYMIRNLTKSYAFNFSCLDYTSSLLFDSDRGILRFLLSNMNKPEHISAKCNFLEFLARYIERVGTSIHPYAVDIKVSNRIHKIQSEIPLRICNSLRASYHPRNKFEMAFFVL